MGPLDLIFLVSLFILSARGAVTWTTTPFNPPSFPLAVRTPYLSAWLAQKNGTALNDDWPTFWQGQIVGWAGFVKVDSQVYSFLGAPSAGAPFTKATQKATTFTSTQSIFELTAGPVDLTVNFLSPVEPDDLTKQSMPFSYMSVTVASNDGGSHTVQVYSDISAEWVSGDRGLSVNWTTSPDTVFTHKVQLQNATIFAENQDQTQYGSAYYSTLGGNSVTYQTGADADVRTQFVSNGKLANTLDSAFRAINDRFPVFAFAHDLGTVSTGSNPIVLVSIGHVRDPAIQYITAGGALQNRSSYFLSQFSTVDDAIDSFLTDFPNALSRANAFDTQVNNDASNISPDYAGLVALSIRQALGATEVTVSKTGANSFNTDDVLVFMKEISSDGNTNTVDVIFPAWPLFLYTNPALGRDLLEVLFQYQATGQYPNRFSAHDIGAHYPNAIGHNDGKDEAMPVEESGNMVIMALSYAQKTGDNSQLQKYSALLDQWTQFLIEDSLIPNDQLSTDDFAGTLANQTNLAIKGIVGIKAMAEIWAILGDGAKSANYSSIATSYVSQWQSLAMSSTGNHLTLSYGDDQSWGLTYNLYGDKLLGLDLFPAAIYDMQTQWYKAQAKPFGVPLDTRHTYTKSDWSIWMAAIVTDIAVRDTFISSVMKWASDGKSSAPFGDWYETLDGSPEAFRARPVVGGHLALLALNSSSGTTDVNGSSASSTPKDSSSVNLKLGRSFTYVGLSLILTVILSDLNVLLQW